MPAIERSSRHKAQRSCSITDLITTLGMVPTGIIVHLTKMRKGFDAICIYVDRLSRKVTLISSRTSDTAKTVAGVFFANSLPQYGLPDALITDRDPIFTSKF